MNGGCESVDFLSRDFQLRSVCMTLPTVKNPTHGIFLHRRLSALAELVRVEAICPEPFFLSRKYQESETFGSRYKTHFTSMFYIPGIFKFLDACWMEKAIAKWINSEQSSVEKIVIDAHFGYPEGVACWRLANKLKVPCFVTLRGVEEEWVKQGLVRQQLRNCLRSVDGVIAVSHSLAKLARELGTREEQIRVIPNGIDHHIFFPSSRNSFDNRATRIVCVGNIRQVKGHDILLRALSKLMRQGFEFELSLIGGAVESSFAAKLDQLIRDLGIASKVKRLGSLPPKEVARILRQSDLFVLASRREGCCNAILEALACGLPVVATDVGDNGRYVKSGVNGQIVASNDEIALADAIENVAGQEMDRRAISNGVSNLSWAKTAHDVIDFMQERIFV